MPISGFKANDEVQTPSGRKAVVVSTRRVDGRERVKVRFVAGFWTGTTREFPAQSLKMLTR